MCAGALGELNQTPNSGAVDELEVRQIYDDSGKAVRKETVDLGLHRGDACEVEFAGELDQAGFDLWSELDRERFGLDA